ncbi:response regulator transcription factor [Papillibacter cinnamivorans]|nr:response regulator transcription factor [Papillibacter cinnamivorans]
MQKILVVDDEREIADLISDALSDEGFETLIAYDGEEALRLLSSNRDISLILLDIMMPKTDGLGVCRRIRENVSCPIVFVTAKNRVFDTLLGFEMGGDDYITKPFVVEELVARVKAHLRREARSTRARQEKLQVGELELYRDSYEAFFRSKPVELSTREFQVLLCLCENAGRVLSREQIFDAVWGGEFGDVGTVTVNIKNLRDKLGEGGAYIRTVWGVGYKLVNPAGGAA